MTPDPTVGSEPAQAGSASLGSASGPAPSGPTLPRLHVITDDRILAAPDFMNRAQEVLEAAGSGVALHIRGPGTTGRLLHDRSSSLRGFATAVGACLIVNDRVDVAIASGADGVQLRSNSLSIRELPEHFALPLGAGVSVHSAGEARAAGAADWLLVGTLWTTASHPGRAGAGPSHMSRVLNGRVERSGDGPEATFGATPGIGIGGVTPERVGTVMGEGAHGVAVLSTIWEAPDPAVAVEHYLRTIESVLSKGSPS